MHQFTEMSPSVNISSYLKGSLCHELEQEMNQQLLWELLETDVISLNEVWHLDITKALQLQAASQKQDMTKIKLRKKKSNATWRKVWRSWFMQSNIK